MPSLRRGESAPPKKVFRNGVSIKRIMRNGVQFWASFQDYLMEYTIPAPYQPPMGSSTIRANAPTPHDMIADIDLNVQWRSSQSSQISMLQVGSWWVANAVGGQTLSLKRRLFIPGGTVIGFIADNNTTSSLRWIDSGVMSVRAIDTLNPDLSGQLVRYNISVNVWGRVMTWIAPRDMNITAAINGLVWGTDPTSTSNRQIRICKNGVQMAISPDEGTSVSTAMSVAKYDEISFEAMSASSNTSYRDVNAGTWSIQIN